jgi:hypothetical protein
LWPFFSKGKPVFIILLALKINLLYVQAVVPGGIEKGIRLFLSSAPIEECKKHFSECEELYELNLLKETNNISTRFKAMALFRTVYEFAEACHEGDKLTCDLVTAIFDDSKDECHKFSPKNNILCSDVKNFRLNSCGNIRDPLLLSVCSKNLVSACRSDMVCMITWANVFRENAESLKLVSPTIIKAFYDDYNGSKSNIKNDLNYFPNIPLVESDIVKAPLFPSPQKIINFSVTKTIILKSKSPKATKPSFKPLKVIKNAFIPNMRQLFQPWSRGAGVTVVDWDGDGLLDIFTVDGENILMFENLDGIGFRKHSIALTLYGLKGVLIDISVADIDGDGTPSILVQSFPRNFYVLRWLKEKSSFSIETINLPNFSRTHAFVKFKSGLGIVFPGWNGISSAPNIMASDYVARFKNKKWTFEKLSNSQAPTLGVSVIERAPGISSIVLSRDLEGGTDFYDISGDSLVKIPDTGKMNYFSHSTAMLKTSENENVWISAGLGFNNGKDSHKRKLQANPKTREECDTNWTGAERELCILRYNRGFTSLWPSLCSLNKTFALMKICLAQYENPGIQGVKMQNPFVFTSQVFRNLNSPVIDIPASKLASEMGQVWHMSPLKSPSIEGFLMSEARTTGTSPRKLWWMGLTKNGIQKTELTNSLGLSETYDATQFALGDFDKDGQLDMVFKSDSDLIILKGDTGGDSSLTENLQSGHQSRTLIKIPVNKEE